MEGLLSSKFRWGKRSKIVDYDVIMMKYSSDFRRIGEKNGFWKKIMSGNSMNHSYLFAEYTYLKN